MADEETGAPASEDGFVVTKSTPAEQPPAATEPPATVAEETPEPAAVEQPEVAQADDTPVDETVAPKPKAKGNPYQARIDELTKIRREQERRIAELEAARKPASEEPVRSPELPATQEDFEALVSRKAAEIVQQRQTQERTNAWLKAGLAEYKEEFNEKCNLVASLGAAERPDFMQIVTDPDIIPDGHRLVAALADDPAEAMRILSLPPVQMSAALVRYSGKMAAAPKAKPVSAAPAPIKPLDGTARASDEPTDRDSEDEWFRKRQAQLAARAKTGARF